MLQDLTARRLPELRGELGKRVLMTTLSGAVSWQLEPGRGTGGDIASQVVRLVVTQAGMWHVSAWLSSLLLDDHWQPVQAESVGWQITPRGG